jgi:hypothetical protein
MPITERLGPQVIPGGPLGSVASNGTSSLLPVFTAPVAGQLVGARFVASATLSTNWSLNLYKTASNTASRIATTGSQAALAAHTAATITLNGTDANKRLAAGDVVILEVVNQGGTTTGGQVFLDWVPGHETGATPAAGTGPA